MPFKQETMNCGDVTRQRTRRFDVGAVNCTEMAKKYMRKMRRISWFVQIHLRR